MAERFVAAALLVALLAAGAGAAAASDTAALYRDGRGAEAVSAARAALAEAESRGEPRAIWSHLMWVAWLEESLGAHRPALHHAERALEVARGLGAYETGRSLCWLGWSLTSLGLYPSALALYGEAIGYGVEGDRIRHPAVWGLATQEIGAIFARMGALDGGRALLEVTTDYARRHSIDVGVAEGAGHLAEIALLQGDLETAEERADEALRAALRCDCSPYNTGRARTLLARISLERARLDPKHMDLAVQRTDAALDGARAVGDRRHEAEALLVRSRLLDPDDFDARLALVSRATEILDEMRNELRGTAELSLGGLFLESHDDDAAEGWLRAGLATSQELHRALDGAWAEADLAEIDRARGNPEASLAALERAAEQARASGALPLLLHAEEQLSESLESDPHAPPGLALHWTERALETARALDSPRRLPLAERATRLRLETQRGRSLTVAL